MVFTHGSDTLKKPPTKMTKNHRFFGHFWVVFEFLALGRNGGEVQNTQITKNDTKSTILCHFWVVFEGCAEKFDVIRACLSKTPVAIFLQIDDFLSFLAKSVCRFYIQFAEGLFLLKLSVFKQYRSQKPPQNDPRGVKFAFEAVPPRVLQKWQILDPHF
jgi:hypothetical protein